jgi:hypothetical protein
LYKHFFNSLDLDRILKENETLKSELTSCRQIIMDLQNKNDALQKSLVLLTNKKETSAVPFTEKVNSFKHFHSLQN